MFSKTCVLFTVCTYHCIKTKFTSWLASENKLTSNKVGEIVENVSRNIVSPAFYGKYAVLWGSYLCSSDNLWDFASVIYVGTSAYGLALTFCDSPQHCSLCIQARNFIGGGAVIQASETGVWHINIQLRPRGCEILMGVVMVSHV